MRAEFNLTYVSISHDLAVIRQICDRTIVMKRGEIVEHGNTEQIFLSPRQEYTKALIESGRKTSRAATLQESGEDRRAGVGVDASAVCPQEGSSA